MQPLKEQLFPEEWEALQEIKKVGSIEYFIRPRFLFTSSRCPIVGPP